MNQYHVSLTVQAIEVDPALPGLLAKSGIHTIWLIIYGYGYWWASFEQIAAVKSQIEAAGIQAEAITLPFGHPGDSLAGHGDGGGFPITPPKTWRMACRPRGEQYCGTSLHAPAIAENIAALQQLSHMGFTRVVLDDDFRLARSPGDIGGCFCDDHRERFLNLAGLPATAWPMLLADVENRADTPLLRQWLTFTTAELTDCLKQLRESQPTLEIIPMVMPMGAEQTGIDLEAMRGTPLRVGEYAYDDRSFGTVKGKTDELFGALFHRRFTTRAKAYSETTAFPVDQLSIANLTAKLAIPTIAVLGNTYFMSGVIPYPKSHWESLAPAMQQHAEFAKRIGDAKPYGPLKHYWGGASRRVGNAQPYSLFLAMGIPFEVLDHPTSEPGWVFLAKEDVAEWQVAITAGRPEQIVREPVSGKEPQQCVPEDMEALFALKRQIVSKLGNEVPHIVEDSPAVCAWYPAAQSLFIWNMLATPCKLTVRRGQTDTTVELAALGCILMACE